MWTGLPPRKGYDIVSETRASIEKAISDLSNMGATDNTQLGEKAVNIQTIHAMLTGFVALALLDVVDGLDELSERSGDLRKVISSQG